MVDAAPVAPAVVQLVAHIERFCAQPARKGGSELAADMAELGRGRDLIQLKFSEMAAADSVAVGEQIAKLPDATAAMAEGAIGFAHVALMARTATAIAEAEGPVKPFDETRLLEKAREFSVGRFRNFCHHARHAADPEGFAAEQAQGVEARSLTLITGEGGLVWVRGVLDPEGGAVLRTALEPLARRTGKGDYRKRDRRLADAVVELGYRSLDSGQVPQRASQRTHLQVTATLETLLQRAGAPAADLEFSIPISAKTVERMACDCNVTRILLGSDSAVIDVGRSKRVISPSQRRALNARDKGCRWPGCDRHAAWTSGHHVVHWIRGGGGDLPNLVLLCYRHHWMVHEGRWQLVKTDDDQMLAIPPTWDTTAAARDPGFMPAA